MKRFAGMMLGCVLVAMLGCDGESGGGTGGKGGTTGSAGEGGSTSSAGGSTSMGGSGGTGGGQAGSTTGTGGSTGGSTSSTGGAGGSMGAAFGEACTMDSDCEMGLLCYDFTQKGMLCTKQCQSAADCPAPSSGCNGMGYCKPN
ncbi:MAG: hypothetical protein IPK82_22710 [Polyangiaceae bacterium]|nr:hypothetical protein [Polyangiaceae bacterium]